MSEIVSIQQVDQFDGGSAYKCGFESVAECTSMAKPGQAPTKSAADILALAHQWYVQEDGPDVYSNEWGMSLQQLYDTLHMAGLHYQGLPVDLNIIRSYLDVGYPIIVAGAETGFYDLDLGDVVPYPWTPTGNHILVFTGRDGNNFLVRDSANIEAPNTLRPGPRRYDASKLQLISATAVGPSWLPRPTYPLPHQQGVSMQVPDGWRDDGTTLTAPNGIAVVKGFRLHVLNTNWNPANFPLEAEHGVSQEEMSNPTLGGGTQQVFRMATLEWTSARGVYEMWTGQELLFVRQQLVNAQAKIAQLQAIPPVTPINAQQVSEIKTLVSALLNVTAPFVELNTQAAAVQKELS